MRSRDLGFRFAVLINNAQGIPKLVLFALSALIIATTLACSRSSPNQPAAESPQAHPTKEPAPKTGFERDLQFVRNGQFAYVWVFSRPDGKPLDKEDSAYLRANAPQVVDWVTTDNSKRVIAGTNFDLEQSSLPLLRKRFVVENYTGR